MLLLVGALALLFALGCEADEPALESGLPVARMRVGNHEITVEVAADAGSRRRGLMFRESLPEDHGMLFIFPHEQPLAFWMKNTPLPLSIAYADDEGRIVRIADMQPFELTRVTSGAPARYALEMSQGWFARKGVVAGDLLRRIPRPEASGP